MIQVGTFRSMTADRGWMVSKNSIYIQGKDYFDWKDVEKIRILPHKDANNTRFETTIRFQSTTEAAGSRSKG
nr:hypothetical protein CFP56_22004 [Quercus suber]